MVTQGLREMNVTGREDILQMTTCQCEKSPSQNGEAGVLSGN